MTRKVKLLIISGGILVLAAAAVCFLFLHVKEEIAPIDSILVLPYLKDGDVILRMGDGHLSPKFRDMSLTDKRFSHLGIVRIKDGDISIINSVGYIMKRERGVEVKTLEDFLYNAQLLGVYRANFIEGNKISDKAVDYINYPFDWDFDLNDDGKIYCTELLYAVLKFYGLENYLKTIHIEMFNDRVAIRDIVPLDSISNSAAFDEILFIKQRTPPDRGSQLIRKLKVKL